MAKDCCWNCKHYIPPHKDMRIDGPISAVCTIDRKKRGYYFGDEKTKQKDPDDWCKKYEEREYKDLKTIQCEQG